VANRVIALAPERVDKVALIVPAGIVGMSGFNLFRRVAIPQFMYAMTKREAYFQDIMAAFFTDCDDSDIERFFKLTLTGMNLDARQMKLSSLDDTRGFTNPVHVIAAEHDVVFDCRKLEAQVSTLYPHASFEVLKDSKHSPSFKPDNLKMLNDKVIEFLDKESGPDKDSGPDKNSG
jgi:pimeloyl-ACP methyl ester carboxylesterase